MAEIQSRALQAFLSGTGPADRIDDTHQDGGVDMTSRVPFLAPSCSFCSQTSRNKSSRQCNVTGCPSIYSVPSLVDVSPSNSASQCSSKCPAHDLPECVLDPCQLGRVYGIEATCCRNPPSALCAWTSLAVVTGKERCSFGIAV